jgi:hypothetical protein
VAWSRVLQLVDSTVTGNIFAGFQTDLVSGRSPEVTATTCGISIQLGAGDPPYPTGGVCAGD